ncbi:cytochrome c oxidase subunit 4 [Nocardioides bruguierae]|uniref:Cytochrome c oxidase polypeptide 4 n=1 Tax=Nocardioides bruguierae TaxID=2945102 RepID=A0A9X2DAY2_9ACTN|nr:cytochrome c oxidase subunit 4 [Nocardioides bruguierae]MCL8027057.1 cytochrome c oxidase subunit 4 [Nocardioides bruguierae]MCM0622590.1 cytochrome c oxidase subunit 4 [Nocardioides bruguierae]
MKAESWIFAICTVFFVLVTPAYWLITSAGATGGDWTGTVALLMTALLTALITLYLGVIAKRGHERPEDRQDGEIADGAGEYGFFAPFSWWPLWCALALGVICYSVALQAWWLAIIGAVPGIIAVCGLVFEYYRGEFAH